MHFIQRVQLKLTSVAGSYHVPFVMASHTHRAILLLSNAIFHQRRLSMPLFRKWRGRFFQLLSRQRGSLPSLSMCISAGSVGLGILSPLQQSQRMMCLRAGGEIFKIVVSSSL
jgi:hypothetical protein